MDYSYATEKRDYGRIDKLNKLTDINTFWDDVRKLTKNISSDHTIRLWQGLAEIRYEELKKGSRRPKTNGCSLPTKPILWQTVGDCRTA